MYCIVWPWNMVRALNRIEAFELWTFRPLLRIQWTDYLANEEALRKGPTKLIFQGKIDKKRGPKRKQHSWLRNIRRNWCWILDTATIFRWAWSFYSHRKDGCLFEHGTRRRMLFWFCWIIRFGVWVFLSTLWTEQNQS